MTPEQATSQCVQGVAKIIPNCFPGLLVAKEVHILSGLFLRPRMPLVVLIGAQLPLRPCCFYLPITLPYTLDSFDLVLMSLLQ